MTQNINFLPKNYRRKRERHRTARWRQFVLVVFAAIVVVGGIQQKRRGSRLEAERDRLQTDVTRMNGQLQNPASLRTRIQQLDQRAGLMARLHVFTPPTRVLSAVTNALPQYVTLTEYKTIFEKINTRKKRAVSPRGRSAIASASVAQDLKDLNAVHRQRSFIVMVKGIAADDLAISRYLDRLQRDRTFDDIQLLYTDQQTYRDNPMRSFELRLRVSRIASTPMSRSKRTLRPTTVEIQSRAGALRRENRG